MFKKLILPASLLAIAGATWAAVSSQQLHPLRVENQSEPTLVAQVYLEPGSTSYRFVQFTPSAPREFEKLFATTNQFANAGSAIIGDYYYWVFMSSSATATDKVVLYRADSETGEATKEVINDYTLCATETAYDPVKDAIFGQFYDATRSKYEFGYIDYENKTRTTIATTTNFYLAIGVDSKGDAYGVELNGGFYKINTTTGEETKIGNTGITLKNNYGSYLRQTGEIDPATDTFYWYAVNSQQQSTFYTINLTDASLTTLDANTGYILYSMMVKPAAAQTDAPAAPQNLTVSFNGGSNDGTVSFDVPTQTFGGNQLNGTLDYYVVAEGDTLAQGQVEAGAHAEVALTAIADGQHRFIVTLENNAGRSPRASQTLWVGIDELLAPTDVTATLNEQGNVDLTWGAAVAAHGGYAGDVTYTVTRYSDGKVVAQGISATECVDVIGEVDLAAYDYGVKATNSKQESAETRSGRIFVGEGKAIPYTENFNDAASFDLFTIVNSNSDNFTWQWYNSAACYYRNTSKAADDWLITPD